MEFVLTFDSSHLALKAEVEICKLKIKNQIIPTPRSVSSRCGFSLLVTTKGDEKLKDDIYNGSFVYSAIYKKTLKDGIIYYEKKI